MQSMCTINTDNNLKVLRKCAQGKLYCFELMLNVKKPKLNTQVSVNLKHSSIEIMLLIFVTLVKIASSFITLYV